MAESLNCHDHVFVLECVVYYFCPEKSGNILSKTRKRVEIDLSQNLSSTLHKITCDTGIKEEARKIGLSDNVEITLGSVKKSTDSTKVFSITTDATWNLEKKCLKDGSLLQVNVQKKEVFFVKNTPVIQIVCGEDEQYQKETAKRRQGGGRKRNQAKCEEEEFVKRLKTGEHLVRTEQQQKIFDSIQKGMLEENRCTVINEFTIMCGKCSSPIIVPFDRTAAKRAEYFMNRHYRRCKKGRKNTDNKTDLLKQQNSMSQWVKKRDQQEKERNIDVDSDMDTEFANDLTSTE